MSWIGPVIARLWTFDDSQGLWNNVVVHHNLPHFLNGRYITVNGKKRCRASGKSAG